MYGFKSGLCASSGCPFHKLTKELSLRSELIQNDLEDLAQLKQRGTELRACPYYSSRRALSSAELILIPYNILLNRDLREASGVVLKDNILIIDEAHNLTEAVASIHTTNLSKSSLNSYVGQLKNYRSKYSKRFSPKYARNLDILIEMLLKFQSLKLDHGIFKTGEFVLKSGLEKYNLLELLIWIGDMSLCRKLLGVNPTLEENKKVSAVSFLKQRSQKIVDDAPGSNQSRHGLFKVCLLYTSPSPRD